MGDRTQLFGEFQYNRYKTQVKCGVMAHEMKFIVGGILTKIVPNISLTPKGWHVLMLT